MHPFFAGLSPTLHISHRGGSALRPENTLAAFEHAVEAFRTDVLETDVQLTKDGVVVIAHDDTVDRCTDGKGPVSDFTWAQLQRLDAGFRFTPDGGKTYPHRGKGLGLPSLSQALRAFPSTRFNIDLKPESEEAIARFAQVVREQNAEERLCCGSVKARFSNLLADALPKTALWYPEDALVGFVLSLRSEEPIPDEPRFHALAPPLSHDGVRVVDAAFIQAAQAAGKWVLVWTVDEPSQMRELIDLKVGGIMTDRPDLLRAELDSKK